jgi:hypothetical protein
MHWTELTPAVIGVAILFVLAVAGYRKYRANQELKALRSRTLLIRPINHGGGYARH